MPSYKRGIFSEDIRSLCVAEAKEINKMVTGKIQGSGLALMIPSRLLGAG
jgi:hypothetical protein